MLKTDYTRYTYIKDWLYYTVSCSFVYLARLPPDRGMNSELLELVAAAAAVPVGDDPFVPNPPPPGVFIDRRSPATTLTVFLPPRLTELEEPSLAPPL